MKGGIAVKTYQVKVLRGGAGQESRVQAYTVEREDTEVLSIMNILEIISREQDPTLAFFDHAACRQAACGKCLLKVNGATKLACKEIAQEEMLLEPYAPAKVVRDLLCRG